MSILIKNMDMPKNCMECPINDSCYKATVDITSDVPKNVKADWITGRANWCPIVEIPKPHGRLIDAKKFEEENEEFWHRDFIHPMYEDTLCDLFDRAPTVIEGEE